jgi:IPT/TIG domain
MKNTNSGRVKAKKGLANGTNRKNIYFALLFCSIFLVFPGMAFSQWSSDASENTPVVTADGTQGSHRIINDGNYGYFVVWQDQRDTETRGRDIYAQHFDYAGVPQWGENGIVVCDSENLEYYPKVTLDGAGGIIVAWYVSEESVFAQRINADGIAQWQDPVLVIPDEECGWIVSDGDGGAIIMGRYGTANRVASDGSLPWGEDGVEFGPDADYYPKLISDGAGGAILVWVEDSEVAVQQVNSAGELMWNEGAPVLLTDTGGGECPRIVSDSSGGAIVIWDEYRDDIYSLFAQRVDSGGVAQWTANGVLVTDDYYDSYDHGLASDGAGGAFVTWADSDGDNLYARRIGSDGTLAWDEPVQLTDTDDFYDNSDSPRKTIEDGSGGCITVWVNDSYEVRAQRVDGNGDPVWTDGGKVLSNAEGADPSCPRIVSNSQGWGAVAVWSDSRNGSADIYMQNISADGVLGLGPAPTVTSITPSSGSTAGGTEVTISGENFIDRATVTFGGVEATGVTVASITATTPANDAVTVDVTVTNPDGQSATLSNGFTYKYTITSSAGSNGAITPLGETLVAAGGSQAYTMEADSSYEIDDVLVDGASVGAVSTYTFSDVNKDYTISVTFSLQDVEPSDEENVAPDAPVLTSPANAAVDVSLTPTLAAGAFSDANAGDTHSQTDWQISTLDDFSSLVLDVSSETSLKSFAVPDLILNPSTTYYWRAAYYDDEGAASDFSEAFSFTTEADADDLDGDGIPDDQEVDEETDLDGDGVDDRDQDDFTPIKSSKPGKSIGMKLPPGLVLNALKSLSEDDFSDTGLPPNILFPFGVLSFKIEGVDAGGTTAIEIFFSEAFPDVPLWHKYFETSGSWGDFSDNVQFVEEGGTYKVILTLVDGGFGDLDGVENGIIVDPSGLTEVEETGGSSSEGWLPSCFIDAAGFDI